MPSTTHPAPLCPPYISSPLHSLSSAHSSIPKYQMSKRLLWGWPSQGSPCTGWANGTPCESMSTSTQDTQLHPLLRDACLPGEQGLEDKHIWYTSPFLAQPGQPTFSHTKWHLHTLDFHQCPKFTLESLASSQFKELLGVGKKRPNHYCLLKSNFCT